MYTAFASQGLAIIAVDVDRQRQDAEKFLASYRPAFAVQFDPNGEIAERFQVKGMPTGLLIDRHGAVRFRHIGFRPVDRAIYEQQLRQLLEEP